MFDIYLLSFKKNLNFNVCLEFIIYSTANIKAVSGSLWWLSVNKLSHIPELQSVSAVYENQ